MDQKDVFLQSEADAYYRRNVARLGAAAQPESDPLLRTLLTLPEADLAPVTRVLEIGCGDGARLAWLRDHRGVAGYGVEPSAEAVRSGQSRGIDTQQGTADSLPFPAAHFDIVMFGFCLYLCDRSDLHRIASEADRVLRNPGWLLIHDFFSPAPKQREYHHRAGLFSYKMNYASLFTCNPAYTLYSHNVRHHADASFTDDCDEWVATSLLRKRIGGDTR